MLVYRARRNRHGRKRLHVREASARRRNERDEIRVHDAVIPL
jgi:hypothetical protein